MLETHTGAALPAYAQPAVVKRRADCTQLCAFNVSRWAEAAALQNALKYADCAHLKLGACACARWCTHRVTGFPTSHLAVDRLPWLETVDAVERTAAPTREEAPIDQLLHAYSQRLLLLPQDAAHSSNF